MRRRTAAAILTSLLSLTPTFGQDWRLYRNPDFAYSIELPSDYQDELRENDPATIRLVEGETELTVFDGTNIEGWSASEFADFVARADRIARVTYRRAGQSWFVLSGYYRRDGTERQDLIFYTKFMLSPDGSRFAGFEISYPLADKRALDAVVDRLEATFRGPR